MQKSLVREIRKGPRDLNLLQVTWKAEEHNLPRNSVARTRGFAFLLLGAVCAILEGQSLLNVYENGIGALNLPYRASEVGLDHSRAVNPMSLLRMQELVSHWVGQPFHIQNPFLFKTKAELCARLGASNFRPLIAETVTCDRIQRQPGERMQCGRCSSCLLRRQALAAAGIADETHYAATCYRQDAPAGDLDDGNFLRAMLNQVLTFRALLETSDPWSAVARQYPDVCDAADWVPSSHGTAANSRNDFPQLMRRHVNEWVVVWEMLANGLFDSTEIQTWRSKLTSTSAGFAQSEPILMNQLRFCIVK